MTEALSRECQACAPPFAEPNPQCNGPRICDCLCHAVNGVRR